MDAQVLKAGWLQRRTSVLHRWKKNWFVLFRSGELAYYDSEDCHKAEERFMMSVVVLGIRTALECDCSPPDGFGKRCQLTLLLFGGDSLELCAETPDDMKAWHMVLEEARVRRASNMSVSMTAETITHGFPGQIISPPPVISVQQSYTDADGKHAVINNPQPQVITKEGPGWISQQASFHSGSTVLPNPGVGPGYYW